MVEVRNQFGQLKSSESGLMDILEVDINEEHVILNIGNLAILYGGYERYVFLWLIYRFNKAISGIMKYPNRYLNELNSLKDDISKVCKENHLEISKAVYKFHYSNNGVNDSIVQNDSIIQVECPSFELDTDDEYVSSISGTFEDYVLDVINEEFEQERMGNRRFVTYLSDNQFDMIGELSLDDGYGLLDNVVQSSEDKDTYTESKFKSVSTSLSQTLSYIMDNYGIHSRPGVYTDGGINKNPNCRRLYTLYKSVLSGAVSLISRDNAMILLDSIHFSDAGANKVGVQLLKSFMEIGGKAVLVVGDNDSINTILQ